MLGANANCTIWHEENWPRASEKSHNSKYVRNLFNADYEIPSHNETEDFLKLIFNFLQFHEILLSFISILCWTKRKYLRIRKVKSSGFIKVLTQLQSLIIFCASAEIFETFFFQLLLPGKTLHVSQGTFAKKFWTYFLLLTVLILEYFFA